MPGIVGKASRFSVGSFALLCAFIATAQISIAASRCSFESKVQIKNDTGYHLTAAGFVHRYGKAADRGDVDSYTWYDIKDGETKGPYTVHSHSTSREDWWTVVFSYKEKHTNEDLAFQLYPHNLQKQLDDTQALLLAALQTISSTQLKALAEDFPPSATVEPMVKVFLSALANVKDPSLHRYGSVELDCDKDVDKTTTITIGNKSDRKKKNIIKIQTQDETEEFDYAALALKPSDVKGLLKAPLDRLKEQPAAQATKKDGQTSGDSSKQD